MIYTLTVDGNAIDEIEAPVLPESQKKEIIYWFCHYLKISDRGVKLGRAK